MNLHFAHNTLMMLLALNSIGSGDVRAVVVNTTNGEINIQTAEKDVAMPTTIELAPGQYALKCAFQINEKGGKKRMLMTFVGGDQAPQISGDQLKLVAALLQNMGFNDLAALHPVGGEHKTYAYGAEFDGDGPRIVAIGKANDVNDFLRPDDGVYALTLLGLLKVNTETFEIVGEPIQWTMDSDKLENFNPANVDSISRQIQGGKDTSGVHFANIRNGKPVVCKLDLAGDKPRLTAVATSNLGGNTTVFGPLGGDKGTIALDVNGEYVEIPTDVFVERAIPQYAG